MDSLTGGAVIAFADGEIGRTAEALEFTLNVAHRGPGKLAAPPEVLELLRQLRAAAASSAEFREFRLNMQLRAAGSAAASEPGAGAPSWSQPAWLRTTEAAEAAEISTSYLRRLIRRSEVRATGGRGGYLVEMASLAERLGGRREVTTGKAA